MQLCSGPLSVCTAPSGYYYGLPQPSALKCVSSGVPITPHRCVYVSVCSILKSCAQMCTSVSQVFYPYVCICIYVWIFACIYVVSVCVYVCVCVHIFTCMFKLTFTPHVFSLCACCTCSFDGLSHSSLAVRQYEMAVINHFITRRNYAQLDTSGTTIVTIPLLGTHTFTTPTTGAVLLQTFEIIVFPGEAFDTCNFAQDGEEGSMRHVYASLDGYKRYTLDFLWTYVRPVNIVVDISCGAWFSYTPEALHHKTQVNLKLNISLVRGQ